jgi:hypothetical protein
MNVFQNALVTDILISMHCASNELSLNKCRKTGHKGKIVTFKKFPKQYQMNNSSLKRICAC